MNDEATLGIPESDPQEFFDAVIGGMRTLLTYQYENGLETKNKYYPRPVEFSDDPGMDKAIETFFTTDHE